MPLSFEGKAKFDTLPESASFESNYDASQSPTSRSVQRRERLAEAHPNGCCSAAEAGRCGDLPLIEHRDCADPAMQIP